MTGTALNGVNFADIVTLKDLITGSGMPQAGVQKKQKVWP